MLSCTLSTVTLAVLHCCLPCARFLFPKALLPLSVCCFLAAPLQSRHTWPSRHSYISKWSCVETLRGCSPLERVCVRYLDQHMHTHTIRAHFIGTQFLHQLTLHIYWTTLWEGTGGREGVVADKGGNRAGYVLKGVVLTPANRFKDDHH